MNKIIEKGRLPDKYKNSYTFKELWSLKPDIRSSVIIYDKELDYFYDKQIYRSYMSYLNTPKFDSRIKKSYMFLNKEKELPVCLEWALDFAKTIDPRFNELLINFYEEDDYIEPHRDCNNNMISKDAPILCVTLNENSTSNRILTLDPVSKGSNINTEFHYLENNSYYLLKDNINYRHSVGTGSSRRISITFRMIKKDGEQ